jgi:flavin reductase (DIM6/NTAB) family NADH-FMN oxidoreductase RutF
MSEPVNPEELRKAMRTWVTGVAIVTGCYDGFCHGMTANSFNSIALSPPIVLVALNQGTRTQHLVLASGFFGVTILQTNQRELAQLFAGQLGEDKPRLESVETFTMVSGAPLIKNGLAWFDCQVVNTFDVGGTTVFLGEVLAISNRENEHSPLLYFNRRWRKLGEE